MVNTKQLCCLTLALGLALNGFSQQRLSANHGHSHNDYRQEIPFLTAYAARMGSIEADIFLKDNELYVAHDSSEIQAGHTLKQMYLNPLAQRFRDNEGRAYPEKENRLQLVIDLKQAASVVLPTLIKQLKEYKDLFDWQHNPQAVRLLLSGNIPSPENFSFVPDWLLFDGRPEINYTGQQWKRIGMVSQSLDTYTKWNGKGNPVAKDEAKLRAIIDAVHAKGKSFRFWASQDSPNTWLVLGKLGVDWINTDVPNHLRDYYANQDKLNYELSVPYKTYRATHLKDGVEVKPRNIILLIGDGMGLAQIHAGLMANHGDLNLSNMRNIGFSVTYSADAGNTDSAAGGTAIATGHKTNNRFVGVDSMGKPLTNLVDTLAVKGMKSGVISSGDITDATPAAFYAHKSERALSQEIAADLLNSKVHILVGSNQKSFLNNKNPNLITDLSKQGFQLQTSLKSFEQQQKGRQLVLLPDSATRPVKDGRGDMLKRSLLQTIAMLNNNKKGFFIMAEGAQVDYGGHANNLPYLVTEMHDLDRTLAAALQFADANGETLVLVTADHETGGLSLLDTNPAKGSITGNFSTNDHTNIMVPVFAYGPGAKHFTGIYQNNQIFYKILEVLNLR